MFLFPCGNPADLHRQGSFAYMLYYAYKMLAHIRPEPLSVAGESEYIQDPSPARGAHNKSNSRQTDKRSSTVLYDSSRSLLVSERRIQML